jgi:putative SOS response-associated peptidase YedK
MRATALPLGAPPGATRAVIRRVADEIEMVNLRWGLGAIAGEDGNGRRFIRSEGRAFPSHRCLIPASEFQVVRNDEPYRVALEDGDWFYLAGIWQPAERDWPEAFAVLTVEANGEVARYQSRQGALLRRNRHMAWLDHTIAQSEILVPPPAGIFTISRMPADLQGGLAL